jgi:hypothetical protein
MWCFHQIARNGKTGGGIAVIHKSNIEVKRSKHSQTFSHFELLECDVVVKSHHFRLCVIYLTLIVRCSLDMLYESMVTKSFIKFPSIAQIHIIKVKVKIARDK